MKFYTAFVVIMFSVTGIENQSLALPLDAQAADILTIVRTVQARGNDAQLSPAELKAVLVVTDTDNVVVRMAAAYALAFTDAEEGQQALDKLREDKKADVVSVARFATLLKQALDLNSEERLSLLSFQLAKSDGQWFRTLLVARLGDEYRDSIVPMLLAALEVEKDPLVRTEMFFQAASYGNQQQLNEINVLLQREKKNPATAYHEAVCTFLNMVSTNKNTRDVLPDAMKRLIESRLKAMDSSSGK
jgi:CMP-N-acetylneuraminic acid synthetase